MNARKQLSINSGQTMSGNRSEKRWGDIKLGVWLLVLVITLCGFSSSGTADMRSQEPGFANKSLRQWIQQLKSEDALKRLEAIKAIAQIGPKAKAAVPVLIEALADNDICSFQAARAG